MNISKVFRSTLGVIGVILVLAIAASVVLGSLNSARSKSASYLSTGGSFAPNMAYDSMEESGGRAYSQKASVANSGDDIAGSYADDRQIIKTGSLELVVEDVEGSADVITSITKKYRGLIAYQDISDSQNNKKRASITIRVPNENFEAAIDELKEHAIKITRELVNTKDVTEEYADLQAQLKNKRAVEVQYLETLKKAWTIEDILRVQERLDRTRGDIERLEGRITYMERQVSMSTISISLVSESEVAVLGIIWNPLTKLKQAAYNALESIISFVYFVIDLVFVIPIILVWAATIGGLGIAAWKIILLVKRRLFKPSTEGL